MKIRRLRKFRKPRTGELVTFETKQYYVTDTGDVYDGDRHRYLTQYEMQGYMHVALRGDDGRQHTTIKVHGLVASVFKRLLCKGENVHHIDHDKKNNRLENLEIIDGSEHSRQHTIEKWRNGTMNYHGEKLKESWRDGRRDCQKKRVAQIGIDGHLIHVWPSTCEAGRNGYNQGNVAACCRGCFNRPGNNVYKGFKWQWLEDFKATSTYTQPVTDQVQLELNFNED